MTLDKLTSRRLGASPLMVLAFMGTVGVGGTTIIRRETALTTEQARALSDARNRADAIQQHCNERYDDLMLRYMGKTP